MSLKVTKSLGRAAFLLASSLALASAPIPAWTFALGTGQESSATRSVGTIKAINGHSITLAPDSGSPVTVTVQDSTKMVRVEPGQKTLQGATPLQFQDLQVGDRVLLRGIPSADGTSVSAALIVVMKKGDIQQKQQEEEQEWQKNSVGGLVKSADPNGGAIVISTGSGPTAKTVTVNTSKDTVLRRYAANSVKFSDSTPGSFDEIKPGDQLRALGTRSPDGGALAAKEVVFGSFRNIAGTIISVDAAGDQLSVNDLLTKQPVQVKLTPESKIKKLPAMMAQMIAMRLKGNGPGQEGQPGQPGNGAAGGGAAAGNASGTAQTGRFSGSGEGPSGSEHRWGGGAGGPGGRAEFQQVLNRLPDAKPADLSKGDAVMIVATDTGTGGGITAITLLGGVEPILTAAPSSRQAASFMSGWTLGGGGGGEGGDAAP